MPTRTPAPSTLKIKLIIIKQKTAVSAVFVFVFPYINENRIQQPILVTFVQDMERQQMQVHEQMSL